MNRLLISALLLTITLTLHGTLHADEPVASGLLFSSKTESLTERTSLELFDGKYKKFKRDFSIGFDISFWNTNRFGYILRLIDRGDEAVSLVFVNFRGDDNYYIDFNTSRTGKNVPVKVHPDLLGEGKWIKVSMDFDLAADRVLIRVHDVEMVCENVGLSDPSHLKTVFGLHGTNLDLPAMAIKDIRIAEKGKIKYVFPLNESRGEAVHDHKGRERGFVKNPTWLINKHFNWIMAASFVSQVNAGITYNPMLEEVYVVNRDSLTVFHTDSRVVTSRSVARFPFDIVSGEAVYNPKTNHICIYNLNDEDTDTPSFATLNMETLELDFVGDPDLPNRLHHHNAFFDPEKDTLFIFGGYGNFSYSDRMYRYDQLSDDWIDVPLSGDVIYPRFFAASGVGREESEILLFGGFGNRSGRQELGGKNLYDLVAIDLETKQAHKIWEVARDSLYIPATNLLLSRDKKQFYALMYPHHIASSHLTLCRFDMRDGSAEVVSNQIPILSEEIATQAYLFFNRSMNEYIAVVREFRDKATSNVRIYTLGSPAVSAAQLIDYGRRKHTLIYILPALAAAAAATAGIIVYRRRRKLSEEMEIAGNTSIPESVKVRKNAVYILGDFLVFDAKGSDITYRFSAKLKTLFALILLHSKTGDGGISTEKLTTIIWPDKEFAEAKNIRGVTVNHLRKIIHDLSGIELVHENSRWFFRFADSFHCDYIVCMELCGGIIGTRDGSQKDVDELVRSVGRGPLLPTVTDQWLESYRHEYEKTIEKAFRLHIRVLYSQQHYDRIISLADALFAVDPLNEDMLAIGVRVLRKMNRPDRALKMYNKFNTRFKSTTGEDYPTAFQSL